jgi:hypothetical protein
MEETEITIKDESMTGTIRNQFVMKVQKENVKVKDLIKSRVFHEVNLFNRSKSEFFQGLVQPLDSDSVEGKLNHYKMRKPKLIDAEKQYYLALNAFQNNGFCMLIDNEQYSDLEEEIKIHKNLSVSFVRLIALVGG